MRGRLQGLRAHHTPLVVPRAHDCTTLYLGSRGRYQALFQTNPGTYWYSRDYSEHNPLGDPLLPGAAARRYREYAEKYGEDNAAYLLAVLGDSAAHYSRALVIDTGHPEGEAYAQAVQARAAARGWAFQREPGQPRLLEQLAAGTWPQADFLVVPAGYRIVHNDSELIIGAEPNGP
ncbi:MAG: DUF1638 domain-containing protein [Anaerolineae bacterium]|nr:DUF1638 domain-containing protein [Anaerolineae bacterium]